MPTALRSEWIDFTKILPYRDFLGRWQLPFRTQRRKIFENSKVRWQYREREETDREWTDRQW